MDAMERYFFEIPVYRCSPERFEEETKELFDVINQQFKHHKRILKVQEMDPKFVNRFRGQYYGYEYNEVVGWIRLFVSGDQIRGKYFYEASTNGRNKPKQRLNRNLRKKCFADFDKAFELTIDPDLSSSEILDLLIEELQAVNKRVKPFRNRYIELEPLQNIGSFVNWRRLMKKIELF